MKEGPAADTYYGYGWSIGESAWGGRLIEHNGGNGAFFADFLRYTDDQIVVILSTNDSEVRGGKLSHALGRMAHGDDVPVPKPPTATQARPLGTSGRDAVIRGLVMWVVFAGAAIAVQSQRHIRIDVLNLILSNMYGPEDHFEEERSHALGALIMKIANARRLDLPKVSVWGTGTPVRAGRSPAGPSTGRRCR